MRSELPRFTKTHHIHDISLETCPYTPYSQSGMISVIMEAVQAVFQAQIRGKSKTDQPIKRFFVPILTEYLDFNFDVLLFLCY